MAEFDFQSVIFYDRDGGSTNFSFDNDAFLDHPGTLNDGDGAGDTVFDSNDSFQFTITQEILDAFPSAPYSLGQKVTLDYFGTYTEGGITYVVLEDTNNTDFGFFFSPEDSSTSFGSGLSKTVNVDDVDNSDFTVCFAAGTLIATPEGVCAVEELKIGDLVTTADGRQVAVKWIGRQTVHKIFTPAERFCPVRIRAGALGGGLPRADLTVTGDHALMIDGFAINASALVNGASIDWVPMAELPDRVTYYHVETEAHDVILAHGAPAETYVDYVTRRRFDNFAEYLALYGEEAVIREMDVPRVSSARLVPPAIRDRLARHAAA
ncbi:hypothetical protein PSA7680_00291 [Pseudoruegeria aquimaris]|uniref:Hedgehog/Intein (Hint) domain-containing protein n=1 Tax=Pseudoruegeria aquimaris TaxID=393663 RepID=A0A1Y5RCD6_9RHOB|nr:Hint domain-containing protein [Pseudoruegeria aquimaris]SLN14116.1 hypothetical protein PSA7680_00291 [Pseudoruegeria aquimaris]